MTKLVGAACAALALSWAAGAAAQQADSSASPSPAPSSDDPISDYFAHWFDRVKEAQESQPHWITPVATVTPRLEEEFRYDQTWQTQGTGADIANFDSGKGLELIPTTSNEILINLPPYEERTVKKDASGWADWGFLTIKQRLLSANEQNGDYIVTAFLGFTAPTGSTAFTNHAWLVTPTLAAGKGFGDFDIQATLGAQLPMSNYGTLGDAIVGNATLQYHVGRYFWPEVEVNMTHWAGGVRDGKTQYFVTPGMVLGRFPIAGRVKGIVGFGYQIAVSPKLTTVPALLPTYDTGAIATFRLAF